MTSYGSVCSGIEAASVAWEPLGWHADWFSEVDKFPSAVLAHHWHDVTNWGDMTALPELVRAGIIEAPDVLVGGTPCQAFSVAGLRGGLSDERGQLTLKFVELANEIDNRRPDDMGSVIVWENVPGVLSSKDNAFGCFLGALAGEDEPLQPSGKRWPNAGCVFGPQRTVAWRILDAQFFGVAQRRRRVFVVASARDGFDPSAVLFEFDGVRRDTPPSREAGQSTTADVGAGIKASGSHGEIVGALCARDYKGVGNQYVGEGKLMVATHPPQIGNTLTARMYKGVNSTLDEGQSLVYPIHDKTTRHAGATGKGSGNGLGVGQDGDPCPTLTAGDKHAVFTSGIDEPLSLHENQRGELRLSETTGLLTTQGGKPGQGYPCVAVHGTQDPIVSDNRAHALGRNNGGENAVYIGGIDYENNAHTMNSPTEPLMAGSRSGGGRPLPAIVADAAVRRLTPTECERLQGFPDGHTCIPWRNKPADQCPDGPRYKALGNSMAVPVMRWIGERIQMQLLGFL